MQLSNLNFSNFKNWKNFNTDLAKINLFFGQNSSGKSSIIQLLLLLKQTVENTDDKVVLFLGDNKSYINLGNFDEIINKTTKIKELNFGINLNFLNFNVKISRNILGIVELREFYANNSSFSIYVSKNVSKYNVRLEHKKLNQIHDFDIENVNQFYKIPNLSPIDQLYKDDLYYIEGTIRLLFSRMIYIGPLRENPKREYKWTGSRHSHFGIRGENTFDAIITSIKENEKYTSQHFNIEGSLAERF